MGKFKIYRQNVDGNRYVNFKKKEEKLVAKLDSKRSQQVVEFSVNKTGRLWSFK